MTEPVPQHDHGGPRADGLPKRRTKAAPSPTSSRSTLARRIVELAEDKKAADIVLLDLPGLTTLADYFVIASGGSERQIDAIADGIASGLRDERHPADRTRGNGRIALGAARLRFGRRPRLHAAGARLLPAREALVRGEDDPARPVGRACSAYRRKWYGRVMSRAVDGP